jgi:hypothetical protein
MSEKRYLNGEITGTALEEAHNGEQMGSFTVKTEDGEEYEAKAFLTGTYADDIVEKLATIGLTAADFLDLDKSIGKSCRISVEPNGDYGDKVYLLGPRRGQTAKPANIQALRTAMAKLTNGGGDDPF